MNTKKPLVPTLDEIWADPVNTLLPTEKSDQYLIISALVEELTPERIDIFFQYISRMPSIMTIIASKKAYNKLGPMFGGSKVWVNYFSKHDTFIMRELFPSSFMSDVSKITNMEEWNNFYETYKSKLNFNN